MFKNNFIILPIKRYILPFMFCLFTLALIIFSKENLTAAKTGLSLWADSVLPALLPFFIATELLSYTSIIPFLGKCLNKIMRPIFNVPGIGSFALIMGIISGYPVGAKIVTKFRQENLCTKEECERLLAFTNNSGPLFIVGTVGISLIGNTFIGILLLVTHVLACISVGIIFRFWKAQPLTTTNNSYDKPEYSKFSKENLVTFSNLGEVLSKSIMSSINTIVMIGGFVVLFSVIVSILQNSRIINLISFSIYPILDIFNIPVNFSNGIITGIIELTNGVKDISIIATKELSKTIILCAFLLGLGGISILLQVFSIISKTDISIKPYILGKILHAILAALYVYIFFLIFPFFGLDL